jgi:hypothetical protein
LHYLGLVGRPLGSLNRSTGRSVILGCALGLASASLSARVAVAQEASAGAAKADDAKAAPLSAQGAKLAQASKALEQLSYSEAQQLAFEVVQSGKATSDELAQAYFTIGVVEASNDNEVESTDSFYLALMLKPALLFPPGGSPKIRARLNEARSRVTEVGVLEARASVVAGVLEVSLRNDPLKLVKHAEVVMTRAGGDVGRANLEKDAMRAQVESDVQSIQVVLYDEVGNQLKVIDVDPGKAGGSPLRQGDSAGAPSVWQHWGLWAGVAGALAIGGTYFVLESGSIQGDIDDAKKEPVPDETEVSRLEDSRDRVNLYGVVGLSMAGAAAVTAGAFLIFGGDSADKPKTEAATEARLVPSVAPGHLGAQFSMRF